MQHLNLLISLHGLMFLDNPEHREWKPTGHCFYYNNGKYGQPVWWSYNLELLRCEQKQHDGQIFDFNGNPVVF